MTNGIGNPDWQRRYDFSAAPLYQATFNTRISSVGPRVDANGYTNLILSVQAAGSTANNWVEIFFYPDGGTSTQVATIAVNLVPNSQSSFKMPVEARFFQVQNNYITGPAGGSAIITVYGTNDPNQNLLTQNTDQRQIGGNSGIAAGVTYTLTSNGTYGGPATIMFADDGNNKWFGTAEYYDRVAVAWVRFLFVFGADHGQSWIQDVNIPYAPVRLNITNQDTVTHGMYLSMVCP